MREFTLAELELTQATTCEAQEAFHMDEESFRDFYERTARPLWAYLSRVLGDASQADDLMQETYYRFLRARIPDLGEAHRRNYLFRVATNLLRDSWRQKKSEPMPMPEGLEVAIHDPTADQIQHQSVLSSALRSLRPREREILWLAYAQGSSHKEIAEALGLKSGSIRLMMFRARKKLAGFLRRQDLARGPVAQRDTRNSA
ncbi:MAG TPA: sigma-70 family RNA polymerase sigma factor [Terriglobia bacterium]|nr:sigma-70 family RNA polymerase sigma factor [Terriglobia bacterium]